MLSIQDEPVQETDDFDPDIPGLIPRSDQPDQNETSTDEYDPKMPGLLPASNSNILLCRSSRSYKWKNYTKHLPIPSTYQSLC